jgi:hypothetical protein
MMFKKVGVGYIHGFAQPFQDVVDVRTPVRDFEKLLRGKCYGFQHRFTLAQICLHKFAIRNVL